MLIKILIDYDFNKKFLALKFMRPFKFLNLFSEKIIISFIKYHDL